MNTKLLSGKKGLITGVANQNSIAWSVAEAAHQNGAEIALTYQGEVLKKRIMPLAEKIDCGAVVECDVTKENSLENVFDLLKTKWGKLDFILHAIAYSDKEELRGRYLDTTLHNFTNAMHISCFSLTSMVKQAESLMSEGGSIVALSYYGATKIVPRYNVMGVAKAALEASVRYLANDVGKNGIRVNSISAGPIKTLAASAIGDFRSMLKVHESTSPLKRNTKAGDVANSSVYLFSDLSSAVTGETHYVDCGYNKMGMFSLED